MVPRKHKLMTAELRKKIPALYSQEDVKNPMVMTHYFNPYGRGDWYVTEFDGTDRMFGLCCVLEGELGYISLAELEKTSVPMGPYKFPLERDLYWKPILLSDAIKAARQKGYEVRYDPTEDEAEI